MNKEEDKWEKKEGKIHDRMKRKSDQNDQSEKSVVTNRRRNKIYRMPWTGARRERGSQWRWVLSHGGGESEFEVRSQLEN